MATGDTQDVVQGLKSALPRGWFSGDTPVLDALLTGLATAWSGMYSAYQYVAAQARIRTATGVWLDLAAMDFFGAALPRQQNELDAQYRARILGALFVEQGTRNAIYYTLLRITGRAPYIFEPARPSDTGAYTQPLLNFANRWANGVVRGNAQDATANSLTLSVADTSATDYYSGSAVRIVAGPGAGQERKGVTSRKNLLVYSQAFDNAAWTKLNSTVSANVAIAPDGTMTAEKLVESTANGGHYIYCPQTASGVTQTLSVYAKAAERTVIGLQFSDFVSYAILATYDLSAGAVIATTGANAEYSNISSSIQSAGNGWYRCILTATKGTINPLNTPTIDLVSGGTSSYTGDGISGCYIWGAQLEAGTTPTTYIRTEANAAIGIGVDRPWSNNRLTYSQAFDNAAWVGNQCAATANATTAPDGTMSADIITASAGATNTYITQTGTTSLANQTLTFSVHVKIGTIAANSLFVLWLRDGAAANVAYASFNISTGAITTTSLGSAATQNLGNGWFRWSVTGTFPAGATPGFQVIVDPAGTPVAGETYYLWGAQLETGPACSSYAATGSLPALPPDATSVYDISPGVYASAWPANASLLGYGNAGGYGSLQMAYQALVKAYLPSTSGIPLVAGYGVLASPVAGASNGAYNTPSQTKYALLADAQPSSAANMVYQAVNAVKPAGTMVWVGTSQ